jgi:signal transduction histidine kinase
MANRAAEPPATPPTRVTRRALIDLALVTAFIWITVLTIHRLDLPAALREWNASHEQWAIDEFTLVSLCVAVALGIFSWRRWQESMRTIELHEQTLIRLKTTESEIASKDQLIRSVSHELRTPLTALLGYAELLNDHGLDSTDRSTMLGTIVRQGRDLANIVEDLLTRAHVEAATLQVTHVPISLGAQTAQVVEDWNPEERAAITATTDRDVRALGDPARVRQIVRNLVSNALRYGEGTVEISTHQDGASFVALKVSNPGPAIPRSEYESIFEPYHRLKESAPAPGGLGLGLAISRQLAEMMGGDLTYERHNEQSVFSLKLPISGG